MKRIEDLNAEELRNLLKVYAVNWLAHDGCWFQGIEKELGMDTAKRYNDKAWERFTKIEAQRILKFLGRSEGEGLDALKEALGFRLYASVNVQDIIEETPKGFIFRMVDCRVQSARERKGMTPYPCQSAGIVEYSGFASAIDPRIRTRCIGCPPDPRNRDFWCAWEFTLDE